MGEGKDAIDDSFDRWIERFRERAKRAGWDKEHQIYQLKLHLEKTAADVFRMLPESVTLIKLLLHYASTSNQLISKVLNFTIGCKVMKPLKN